jgi:hypothetical protein
MLQYFTNICPPAPAIIKTLASIGRLHLFFAQGGLRTMENPGEGCKKGLGKSRGRVKKTAEIQGVG